MDQRLPYRGRLSFNVYKGNVVRLAPLDFEIKDEEDGIKIWASEGMISISVYSGSELLDLGYQRPSDWPR